MSNMEFIPPKRHGKGRPRPVASQPSSAPPPRSSSAQQPHPQTPQSSVLYQQSRAKVSIGSGIRTFLSSKKNIFTTVIIVAVASFLFIGSINSHRAPTKTKQVASSAATTTPASSTAPSKPPDISTTPSFTTVVPNGKTIKQLGGWKRVSPIGKDPVFAYLDIIDGVSISVSQQPLPTGFATNTDSQVADLAKKFNATNKLDAAGTKVYLGLSAQGPQSVILTKKNVLILIKSEKKIADASWIKYVKSLG